MTSPPSPIGAKRGGKAGGRRGERERPAGEAAGEAARAAPLREEREVAGDEGCRYVTLAVVLSLRGVAYIKRCGVRPSNGAAFVQAAVHSSQAKIVVVTSVM
jgi:hypothetical protein